MGQNKCVYIQSISLCRLQKDEKEMDVSRN